MDQNKVEWPLDFLLNDDKYGEKFTDNRDHINKK